jgi:hypothetical protein
MASKDRYVFLAGSISGVMEGVTIQVCGEGLLQQHVSNSVSAFIRAQQQQQL